MKRSMAIVLVLILIIGIYPDNKVYSEKSYEKNLEEITRKMKDLFSITYDYENFNSSVSTHDNTISYYLSWTDSDKEIPSIDLTVDENENIIHYYKDYKAETKDKTNNIDIKQAEELAEEFIKNIVGKDIKEISKAVLNNSDPWDSLYRLQFNRKVDGLPFHTNTIQVNVDKYKKEILNYNSNWDYNMEFPHKNKAIEIDKAKEVLKEDLGLKLIYKTKNAGYPRTTDSPEFYLSYGFLNNDKAIDAISGQVITINRYDRFVGGYGDNVKEESAMDGGLTPQEKEEIEKLSGIYTKKEMEKISRETLQLNNEYKLINSNLHSSWKNKGEFLWNLSFEVQGEEYKAANISLNAKTAEIINFYKYQDQKGKKPIIDKKQALKIANDYLKKIVPDKIGKLEYLEDRSSEDGYNFNFNFIRKEGDIYIEDDSLYIGVNSIDKSLVSYSLNWYNGKIPLKGDIIKLDRAYDILFDEIGYELMYVKTYDIEREFLENPRNNKTQIKLVYDIPPNNSINIDARDGKLLNYSGDEYIPEKEIKYIDLDNSYAKDKIKVLGEYGIGFDGDKFKPKDEIIQKDFVYLLWRSMNPYREKIKNIGKIYEELIDRGIVKKHEKNIDGPISKEQAVAFIIRAMNYEEVAKLQGIYKSIFIDSKDVKIEYIGHVNLAYGFKIIQGDGGNPTRINPKKKLLREDAANIIYNYIFR